MTDNRAIQKLIHVGCRELGIDIDARRDLQLVTTGKESMADMSEDQLKAVLGALKAKGFKVRPGKTRHKRAPRADLRMIHVLWRKLGDAGALRDPSRRGLNAFIRSRFERSWGSVPADVDMMRDWTQIDAVIQALRAWGDRAEIDFDWSEHAR